MAQRRTHVPKFGNWDANDHMPYTAVFNHARQGRGRAINPNDPIENPSGFVGGRRPYNPNDPEDFMDEPDQRVEMPERPTAGSRENSRGRQQQPAPEAPARRVQGNGMPNRPAPDPKRTSRDNNVLDRSLESPALSMDNSVAHASVPGRGARLGSASPAWDRGRKSTGEEPAMFAPGTPNRYNRSKDEIPAKVPVAAVPEFGAWNNQGPQSGDGFTVIFDKMRKEKSGGNLNLSRTPDQNYNNDDLYAPSPNVGYQGGHGSKKNWFCCVRPDVKA